VKSNSRDTFTRRLRAIAESFTERSLPEDLALSITLCYASTFPAIQRQAAADKVMLFYYAGGSTCI